MVWTKEEQELIAILDRFVENCSDSEKLKNINYHRLIRQILAKTKGDIKATQAYCQQVLNSSRNLSQNQEINLEDLIDENFAAENYLTRNNIEHQKEVKNFNASQQDLRDYQVFTTSKFKSFWTVFFLLVSFVAIFFTAKKSPNIASSNTYSNIAIFCPTKLIETAQTGIKNRDEALLIKAIADFKDLKQQQGNLLGLECEQVFWETQFIYAIDFLASQGQRKKAVKNLCEISTKYFQNTEVIPWFTRWSNTNPNFSQWLTQYKANNSCPVARYLE